MRDMQENRLSFSQREGYELPSPMKLEELSADLRRDIWNLIWDTLVENIKSSPFGSYLNSGYFNNLQIVLGRHLPIPHDEISNNFPQIKDRIKSIILEYEFKKLLDFLEDLLFYDGALSLNIAEIFEKRLAAYWLDTSKKPPEFISRSSPEEGEAIRRALKTVEEENDFAGASAHLRAAAKSINAGHFAQSVEESIKAVESVARSIDPNANTLGLALKTLEDTGFIRHPALKEALNKLYGYTSDEQGIRHALLDKDSADVNVDEAQFMFGACASFAAYLINRKRKMSERQGTGH